MSKKACTREIASLCFGLLEGPLGTKWGVGILGFRVKDLRFRIQGV